MTVLGKTINTHVDNTLAIIEWRVKVIEMMVEMGFLTRSFQNAYTQEQMINGLYEKYYGYLTEITLHHPSGVVAHLLFEQSIEQPEHSYCKLSGQGFSTNKRVDAPIGSLNTFKRRLQRAIKRGYDSIDVLKEKAKQARIERQPLIEMAKQVFGKKVPISVLVDTSTTVYVKYKGEKIEIKANGKASVTLINKTYNVRLYKLKAIIDQLNEH